MRIVLSSSTEEAVDTVVTHVLDKIQSLKLPVIGLATGRTMEPVYESWARKGKQLGIDHSRCFFFMLDEYLKLDPTHPSSFTSYIRHRVQKALNLQSSQIAFPPVHLGESGGAHYEQLIREASGIDLQLLGIGQNGHVGFNEPGSHKESRTRIVNLTKETIQANRPQFLDGRIPEQALSMGIGTILEAKQLLMLATGKSKADAIKYLVNHHDDASCPATYLKAHPHFTLVLDPEAASKISLKI